MIDKKLNDFAAQWALAAREQIEKAINEWNKSHPESLQKMRVIWGYSDPNVAAFSGVEGDGCEHFMSQGLIEHLGQQIAVELFDRADDPPLVKFSINFEYPIPFPDEKPDLYNLLQSAMRCGVLPSLQPDAAAGRITVTAVTHEFNLPLEVGERFIGAMLDRLLESADSLGRAAQGVYEIDFWSDDCADLSDDGEELKPT